MLCPRTYAGCGGLFWETFHALWPAAGVRREAPLSFRRREWTSPVSLYARPRRRRSNRLPIILSAVYWLAVGLLLWFGYVGDVAFDRTSRTPVTHSPQIDALVSFGLILVVYLLAAGVWWGLASLRRRSG